MHPKKISVYGFLPSFLMLVCSSFGVSCKKLVEVPPPEDKITKQEVFANDGTALSAMVGLYTEMVRTNFRFGSVAMTLYPALSADELYSTSSAAEYMEFQENELSSGNSIVGSNIWQAGYNLIFQANNVLEGLERSTSVTEPLRTQLIAEAKVVRGFCHFYLTNLFGEIPLITTTDYQVSARVPRLPASQVYQQILNDLQDAKNRLGTAYPSAGKVRPNKWVAAALLARVHLYMGNWNNAESEASAIIDSGMYSLVPDLDQVFLANSSEALWQLLPTSGTVNTWEGNDFIPAAGATPAYPLTSSLLNAFELQDERKTSWTKSVTLGTTTYVYPFKYKVKTAASLTEYYTLVRLAELFLVRAEARARQGKVSEARQDVNLIRVRAGLPLTSAADQPSLLAAIQQERRVELAFEWGHRWMDLKRTQNANAVLGLWKGSTWQTTDTLYPIPYTELLRNPSLLQNPGY